MKLYFECNSGISGDMSVASLLDLGADRKKLEKALESMNLENEFSYKISEVMINSIKAVDFDVILPHEHHEEHKHNTQHEHNKEYCHNHNPEEQLEYNHDNKTHHHHNHLHRNLEDVCKIINSAEIDSKAKDLAEKIFEIVAAAEAQVHNKDIKEIHFHEIGAIDSIVDIVSFSVLFCSLDVEKVYFSTLCEGQGFVKCQHGTLSVPVPAVCEIIKKYQIPIKITKQQGEMITPTGAAIVAGLQSIYGREMLEEEFIIEKIGYGAGKRKYENPILRVMQIK